MKIILSAQKGDFHTAITLFHVILFIVRSRNQIFSFESRKYSIIKDLDRLVYRPSTRVSMDFRYSS